MLVFLFVNNFFCFIAGKIIFTKSDSNGIAELTLDNPGVKNSLNGYMFVQIADIIESLSDWKQGRLIIFNGANGTFCSGGDLNFVKKIANPADGYVMNRFMSETFAKLRILQLISIARIDGFAIGGGAELTVACDLRAMHMNAKIGYVQSKVGFFLIA